MVLIIVVREPKDCILAYLLLLVVVLVLELSDSAAVPVPYGNTGYISICVIVLSGCECYLCLFVYVWLIVLRPLESEDGADKYADIEKPVEGHRIARDVAPGGLD
jgi:hypothetical protein